MGFLGGWKVWDPGPTCKSWPLKAGRAFLYCNWREGQMVADIAFDVRMSI